MPFQGLNPKVSEHWSLRSSVPGYRSVEAGLRFSLGQEAGVTILHCEVRSRPQLSLTSLGHTQTVLGSFMWDGDRESPV